MKKLLSTLLVSTAVFAGAQSVSADQNIVAQTGADIKVNGTLGVDNTNPGATIPPGDPDWINVTLPTDTIFYNKTSAPAIKAPTYDLTNNSGRPVKISVDAFTGTNTGLPGDFDLNLDVTGPATGNAVATASTSLIAKGALQTPTNELITLANSVDQYVQGDTPVAIGTAVNNKATFTYSGTASQTSALTVNYTLKLKFEAVGGW
ncbi:hypothetical protein FACS1894193_08680 [Bacilli bacterium]|nr:hypothetical protein FACS1894193_08680 [Bacilli bacterium]GHU46046.1 hypothetical protein FACS1894194_3050 [Bacilli bacterium]